MFTLPYEVSSGVVVKAIPLMRRRLAGLRRLPGSWSLRACGCSGPCMASTGLPTSLSSVPPAAAALQAHGSFASVVLGRKVSSQYDAAAGQGAAATAACLRFCGAESCKQRRAASYARVLCGSATCSLPEAAELANPASMLRAAAAEFVPAAGTVLQGGGGLSGSGLRAG